MSMLQSGNKPVKIAHVIDDQHGDEGFVQKTEVSVTSAVQQNQMIYVSIWAENKVWCYYKFGAFMKTTLRRNTGSRLSKE